MIQVSHNCVLINVHVIKQTLFCFYARHQEGEKKTQYQSKTLNPVFHEIFTFKLNQSTISKTKLRAAIWDHDFFGEDDFNGEAIIDLSEVDFSSGTHTDWYMLQLQVFTLYIYQLIS